MITREHFRTREDGVELYITYSDIGKMVLQNETGILYDKAIDIDNAQFTYTESDIDIQDESNDNENETLQTTDIL